VRDDHEGDAELFLEVHQFELRVLAQLFVQCTQRLIQQQQLGLLHQRTCERDALPLSAGQLVGFALGKLRQLDQRQHVGHALGDFRGRQLVLLQTEGDVLLHRHVRKQRIRLEHHVDRPLVRRNARHVRAIDPDAAAGGFLETGEHAQQRGLAAARAAEQAEQFLLIDLQRNVVDRDEVAELLGDALDVDVGNRLGIGPGLQLDFRTRVGGHGSPRLLFFLRLTNGGRPLT
jgi:hypothetical protein